MKTKIKEITVEKENGRFFTPNYIVNNILDLSGYCGETILKKHVIDNSCGDGAFLTEIVNRYCYEAVSKKMQIEEIKNDLSVYIHGIEIDSEEKEKCIVNVSNIAVKYNIDTVDWDIHCDDTIKNHCYDGKMDYVIGNPPYVRVHNLGDSLDEIKTFCFSQGGMTDLFIVFYEIGLRMLNKEGVLGYITPSSFFNSLAGTVMRRCFVSENYLDKIVDLKHFQAFEATTYTAIVVLKKDKKDDYVDYYEYDETSLSPVFVEALRPDDYYIANNFYFSQKENLSILKKIFNNIGHCSASVKNGYATLCDSVFINDFSFDSDYIIPVIKSSRGQFGKIFYPYDKQAKLIPLEEIKKDEEMYKYLLDNKERLLKRSNENDSESQWYAFGRSQALNDTYKNKLSINSLLRTEADFKFVFAPEGVGVYSGLYIVSNDISLEEIKKALSSHEFISYVSLLGKYKSGGYYTFSSRDVKVFLDYKFAYDGGLLC